MAPTYNHCHRLVVGTERQHKNGAFCKVPVVFCRFVLFHVLSCRIGKCSAVANSVGEWFNDIYLAHNRGTTRSKCTGSVLSRLYMRSSQAISCILPKTVVLSIINEFKTWQGHHLCIYNYWSVDYVRSEQKCYRNVDHNDLLPVKLGVSIPCQ